MCWEKGKLSVMAWRMSIKNFEQNDFAQSCSTLKQMDENPCLQVVLLAVVANVLITCSN
jgi:hypothetical protein